VTVTFSDGTKVAAAAGKTVASGAQNWSGGNAGATSDPTPPTSSPTGSPSTTPSSTPSSTPTSAPPSTPSNSPTSTPTSTPTSASPTSTPTTSAPATPGKLYLRADGSLGATQAAGSVTLPAANCQCDGSPTNAKTFTASGLNLTLAGGAPTFDLFVDAGTGVGSATQVRISYDLTGDGTWDRVETYRYFPTDPIPGYEHYTQSQQLLSATGTLGSLKNGAVKVEVWSAIGNQPTTLGVGNQSEVTLS
jgi:hypothetical protein